MPLTDMHPNSEAMLEAWKQMTADPSELEGGPVAQDYPGLLGCLFILQGGHPGKLPFRIAGDHLADLFGRNLVGTDFLDLWAAEDRALVSAFAAKVLSDDQPGLFRGIGETGKGRQVNIEIAFAPLGRASGSRGRILALYQVLNCDQRSGPPLVARHRLSGLFPPEPQRPAAHLRLVANND